VTAADPEVSVHVGCSVAFQNPFDARPDLEVYDHELRLALLAEELGFESLWTVEHHFSDYTMCPDPLQLLTWLAARTERVLLGTGVVVLPWHDPVRVAEQIALLDNLSGGRVVLGIGRGIARIEYDGFRVDMDSSRERFVEYAGVVLSALERGWIEADGTFAKIPRRELRPRPQHSFRGRTYAAAVSPESMPIMARMGVGILIIPQKPWPIVEEDFRVYDSVYREANGVAAPAPLSGAFCFVDESADRAEELARRYIGGYYHSVLRHYEFDQAPHEGVKGYEFYTHITRYLDKHGTDQAVEDFVALMPYGTPEQVIEKVALIKEKVGICGFLPHFSFAGMPDDEAERNLRLFAAEVLPELQRWEADPVGLEAVAAQA
jgi:alkanesulfonate monooxygenase SsuD/methylene tetrahydromethanopterin reductase-like flavin-dependent oxidoreductase (luciferase family)